MPPSPCYMMFKGKGAIPSLGWLSLYSSSLSLCSSIQATTWEWPCTLATTLYIPLIHGSPLLTAHLRTSSWPQIQATRDVSPHGQGGSCDLSHFKTCGSEGERDRCEHHCVFLWVGR